MKIILLNNVCKYNDTVFATELIFGDNAKSNLKVPVGFLSQRCEPCGALFSSLTSKQDSRTGGKMEGHLRCPSLKRWCGQTR